jgi:tetratricopeptide (TPR) repeat protein/tRNA A-37 threonylcarbamoyl transferase component Bud32
MTFAYIPAPIPCHHRPVASDPPGKAPISAHEETLAADAPPDRGTMFAPGDLLAERYAIVKFLARGGMGEVYEAEDRDLKERVALKTVRPEIARDETAVARFKREIQLARRITHPNVCRIFDVGYHGETVFLTMELLAGETLSTRVRRAGRFTTAEALPIVEQMASALAAAHAQGIVHRDFKGPNVILAGGRAVVTDFGLARTERREGDASVTGTGAILGSPAYMAPEQVRGNAVGAAADIYALGIVMYEMVTGRLPFEGETPLSVASKRLTDDPPSPRALVADLDPKWERVIAKCLERDPAARPGRVEEIVPALRGGDGAIAPHRERRPILWIAIAIVAVAACVALAVYSLRGSSHPAPTAAPTAPAEAPLTDRVVALLLDDDLIAARKLLEAHLADVPGDAMAHAFLGQTLLKLGEIESSRVEARRAFELSAGLSEDDRLHIEAILDDTIGEPTKAIPVYRKLVAAHPDEMMFVYGLAMTQAWTEDSPDPALATLSVARARSQALADEPWFDEVEGRAREKQGDYAAAAIAYDRGADRPRAQRAPFVRALMRAHAAWAYSTMSDLDVAITRAEEARSVFEPAGRLSDLSDLHLTLGVAYFHIGELARAKDSFAQGLALARKAGKLTDIALTEGNMAWVEGWAGEFEAAEKDLDQAERDAEKVSPPSLPLLGYETLSRGQLIERQGDVNAARPWVERAATSPAKSARLHAFALYGQGHLELDADDRTSARRDLEAAASALDKISQKTDAAQCRLALAQLDLEDAKPADARTHAEAALAEFDREHVALTYVAKSKAVLALIALADGKQADAEALRRDSLAQGVSAEDPDVRFTVRMISAMVIAARGAPNDDATARKELAAVGDESEKLGMRGAALEARLALAIIEARTDATAARAHLENVAKAADALGQKRIARHARDALTRAK